MRLTNHLTVVNISSHRTASSFEQLQHLFEQNHLKHLGFRDEGGNYHEGVLTQLLPEGVFVMETSDPGDPVGVQEHDVHMKDIDW